jgi:hypothetical protein
MWLKWGRQGAMAMKFLGKQSLGRLRRRWDDNIMLDFREIDDDEEK